MLIISKMKLSLGANMRSPASIFGNIVRYISFTVLVLLGIWLKNMAFDGGKVEMVLIVVFLALAAISLWFFIREFNLEQRYFANAPNSRNTVLSNAFGFLFLMVLIIGAFDLIIGWLQAHGQFPGFDSTWSQFDIRDAGFWLNILIVGIILPIMQQFITTGFLFNYVFRGSSIVTAVVGVLISGIIFAALQFQPLLMPAFIQLSLGWLFAISYLYTQRIEVPICLNIFSALLMIIVS